MIRNYLNRLYRLVVPLLYSRRQFKLFLNATLGDINLRMLALASETDYFASLARPVVVKAPFGNSVLVVAPHQDDEAIGWGGALISRARTGRSASIVMLQDGADGHEELGMSRGELNELRNQESRHAAAAIGLEPPVFLNHANLADSASLAAGQVRDLIDDAFDDKMRVLACFKWANQAIDYAHSTRGLNMYHSKILGAGECRYAERFFEIPRWEYIELVDRVRAAAKK